MYDTPSRAAVDFVASRLLLPQGIALVSALVNLAAVLTGLELVLLLL